MTTTPATETVRGVDRAAGSVVVAGVVGRSYPERGRANRGQPPWD